MDAMVGLEQPTCSCSCSVDAQPQRDPTYVFRIAYSSPIACLVASLSNNCLKAYSAGDGSQLVPMLDIVGHTGGVTDVGFHFPDSPSLLHSSSMDGTIRGWDMRTGQEAER